MRVQGNIPKSVTYFAQSATEVGFSWEDDEDNKVTDKVKVRPAYCSDSDNKKTCETGKKWATIRSYNYDKRVYEDEIPPVIETRDNAPMKGIRIVSLEVRAQGGRAYKVVTKDGFYFDLREDVLLDAMLFSSITKGELKGEYIWAKVGSQMKLVRVGSTLHTALVDADARHRSGPVKAGSLEAGQVYRMKNGDYRLYLGKVNTIEICPKEKPRSAWRYRYATASDHEFDCLKKLGPLQAWLEIPEYYFTRHDVSTFEKLIQAYEYKHSATPSEGLRYHTNFVKSAKMTDLDARKFVLPPNYLELMKNFVLKFCNQDEFYTASCSSKFMNMSLVGSTLEVHPSLQKHIK